MVENSGSINKTPVHPQPELKTWQGIAGDLDKVIGKVDIAEFSNSIQVFSPDKKFHGTDPEMQIS